MFITFLHTYVLGTHVCTYLCLYACIISLFTGDKIKRITSQITILKWLCYSNLKCRTTNCNAFIVTITYLYLVIIHVSYALKLLSF